MSTLGASASPPPDLHMHQSLSPMPSPNLNSGTESEDLPEIAEAALAQKTVECDEYARRVEELEEEVLCLRRELATREMLGNVDTALHKDDVLQKLCDIVLLAEAMWKKIRKLQLHEVLRSKALERLYEAEGVVGIKENGVRGGRGNGAMNTGNGGDEDYDDGGEDPLKPLEEVNRELMELRSGVIEVSVALPMIYVNVCEICLLAMSDGLEIGSGLIYSLRLGLGLSHYFNMCIVFRYFVGINWICLL